MITRSEVTNNNPQIFGVTVQNLAAQDIWHPGFVHPYLKETGCNMNGTHLAQDRVQWWAVS
jgi:hypothetical protein